MIFLFLLQPPLSHTPNYHPPLFNINNAMFRSAFSKALSMQLCKSSVQSTVKSRAFNTCAVKAIHTTTNTRPLSARLIQPTLIRHFATVPESVVVKQASTQEGLDITERAIKVRMRFY